MNNPLLSVFKKSLKDGHIDESQLEDINNQINNNIDIVKYVIVNGILESQEITNLISKSFNKKIIDLDNIEIDPDLIESFPDKLIKKHNIIPVYDKDNKVVIASYDPFNKLAQSEVKLHFSESNKIVVFELCDYEELNKKLVILFEESVNFGDFTDADLETLEIETQSKDDDITNLEDVANDAPIIKLSNKILSDSIKLDASDIHIEPYEHTYRIRYRVDGVLKTTMDLKKSLEPKLSARFKIMAGCNIAEKRKPQDGRIKLRLSKTKAIDFRVNMLPTLFGEKIVLRKLDPTSAQMGIDALGYEDYQKKIYMDALTQPQGMILVTGPTGSGKTVSLYTGLNIINKDQINISTAEEPVEINLSGINQVNVNPAQGLTFAEALRSFLRQDPDVIMVGEIRDLETAGIAIKAAQTGHMVMSTLHTNSAAETITRLLNMGVAAFNVATTINIIIAQRLGRKLCDCKIEKSFSEESLLELGFEQKDIDEGFVIYDKNPKGCVKCDGNGYKGRIGVYEVVKITKKISEAIMNGSNSIELMHIQKEEGFDTLRGAALKKVISGMTSIEEANRITQS